MKPLEVVKCPACDLPAEVTRRAVLESTGGPTEHVKVSCLSRRHHFFLPVSMIDKGQHGVG